MTGSETVAVAIAGTVLLPIMIARLAAWFWEFL